MFIYNFYISSLERKGRNWTTIRCVQCGNVERYLIPKDPFITKVTKAEGTKNDEIMEIVE